MPYLVGIAGGSASGKSSFLKTLRSKFAPEEVSIITQDNYYLEKERQKRDEQGAINFDLPDAIDRDALYHDLCHVASGVSIARPEYTFNNAHASSSIIEVRPAPILIIEGLFIFHFQELAKMLDLKVFIDAREEIKLQRRIRRDAEERGYPESDVRYRWEHHVMPCYHSYLRPYRDQCDVIVTNNHNYDKGLNVIENHLKMILSRS